MKALAKIYILIFIASPFTNLQAQKVDDLRFEIKNFSEIKFINIEEIAGNIYVKSHNENAIAISLFLLPIDRNKPNLKRNYDGNLGVEIKKHPNSIEIIGTSRDDNRKYIISLPGDKPLICNLYKNVDSFEMSGFGSYVEINTYIGDINLRDVTGPLVLNTARGDIQVVFSEVNQSGPTSITTGVGEIDLTFPTNSKANFRIKSFKGMFSNRLKVHFDFNDNFSGETTATGKLNDGGVDIYLETTRGDIFLRSQ